MKPQTNHFNTQTGKLKKPFRLIQIRKGNDEAWKGREKVSDWYYVFKYIDGGYFAMHEKLNGKTGIITDLKIIQEL